MTTSPTCIIAYTSEDESLKPVREAAIEMAKTSNASLILYDIDAASPFAKPLPTWWASGDADEQVPPRLDIEDLEKAGRHGIAEQVKKARAAGVDAWAWLPGEKGGDALADYARLQRADLIMLPEAMEDPGIIDRLRSYTLEDVEEHTNRPVAIVHDDGTVEMLEESRDYHRSHEAP